jgi:hypothetical protein
MAALANHIYEESMREQERLKGDVAIGLKANKVLLKKLQQQLKRVWDETDKSDLLHQVNLIKIIVAARQKQLNDAKSYWCLEQNHESIKKGKGEAQTENDSDHG